MCLASGMGATVRVPGDVPSVAGWLFGEDQGRYLLAVDQQEVRPLLKAAGAVGVIAREVGRTGGDALILRDAVPISLNELRAAHESWLPRYMAAGAEV